MFNHVMAEYYGVMTPINQMATINIPEARLVLIKPYEQSQMAAIENAIRNSDLGFNPANDGQVLRINVPQLTEELPRPHQTGQVERGGGQDCYPRYSS